MQNRLRKKESPGQNPNHHCFHRSKFFAFVSLWDFFLLLMLFSPAGDLGGFGDFNLGFFYDVVGATMMSVYY